ncbi:MAG: xylulokinase [Actinomycetota bacterium]
MSYFLGIDVSTTATKALLMDADGSVVAIGRSEYGFDTPKPLWSEQSPESWWNATVDAIRQALASAGVDGSSVRAIGMTGQMHGLVLVDRTGDVLRPAILWNDQRTQAECDEIRELVGRERLISVTGNDALTGFTAPKILWVSRHEPEVYENVEHMLLPKDYVRYRLTREYATDKAGASGTILFDLAGRDWSSQIARDLGIEPSWLPQTFEGPEVTGELTGEAAAATGLVPGTPVVAGGGDQAANAVGVGAVSPGVIAMSLGTSGVVFASADHPEIEPEGRLHAFCHAVPDMWHLMGVMLSAAGSLRWFKDTVAPDASYRAIDEGAASVPAGANGLLFAPYLSGERTPYPDPLARAAFVGLTLRHDVGHMARSVMEGVAFGLRDSVELIASMTTLGEVRISGGGAASALWLQIIADVTGMPVRVVGTPEGAAHGAAILAATGSGAFASVARASEAAVELGPPTEPGGDLAVYEDAYGLYRGIYPALRTTFTGLSNLDA